MTKNQIKKSPRKKGIIRRFIPYYSKYKGIFFLDMLCAALTTLCELVLPLIVKKITGTAQSDISLLTPRLILGCGGFYIILRIIDTAANYYRATMGHVMGAMMETDMRRDLFDHLQKLSFSFFNETKIGTLMSRITSDLFDVTEFAHHCPEEFFIAGVKIVATFIILCTMNVPLTLILFAILPIMILVMVHFSKKMRKAFKDSRKQVGELNAGVEDSLLGIHVVKSFANEDIEKKKFAEGNHKFLDIKRYMYKYMGGFQSSTRFFDGILYIVVVVIGAFFLREGAVSSIDASEYIAYLLYVTTLLSSVRTIVEFSEQFQRGVTGIDRFFEIMDVVPDITDAPDAEEIDPATVKGGVEFENVTFRYNDSGKDVISGLNLSVQPGENIALVGPSGGGKTTLCSLIPRFYDITDGRITLDGTDIRKITLDSLRRSIGVVQQDVYMFSGSIRENIEYGKPGASTEEIIAAAKLAGADEFIKELPQGYDTYVGERGVKLSGGQKQRISIARVFLKNPPLLILDEATSALDNESEKLVQASLEKLAHGRTTFTIAHRLTTIRNADKIVVLTDEGIAEQGTHNELMAAGGMYSKLYKLYTTD